MPKETAMLKLKRRATAILVAIFATLLVLGGVANAKDRAYCVIHNFRGYSDGTEPVGVPAAAKNGDLYGTTTYGGTSDWGTVFKLTAPRTRDGGWRKAVLYNFPGAPGGHYPTSIVVGADGNLYGVDSGQTIFELKPPTTDVFWTYAALYTLNQGSDGAGVQGNLVFDAAGNLYGATELGGDPSCGYGGCGTVFELQKATQQGGQWVYSVLHVFTGTPDGDEPYAGVTLDHQGNIYGTTNFGGSPGPGT